MSSLVEDKLKMIEESQTSETNVRQRNQKLEKEAQIEFRKRTPLMNLGHARFQTLHSSTYQVPLISGETSH